MVLTWEKLHPFDAFASRLYAVDGERRALVGEIARYATCAAHGADGPVFHGFLSNAADLDSLGCWATAEEAQRAVEDARRRR